MHDKKKYSKGVRSLANVNEIDDDDTDDDDDDGYDDDDNNDDDEK